MDWIHSEGYKEVFFQYFGKLFGKARTLGNSEKGMVKEAIINEKNAFFLPLTTKNIRFIKLHESSNEKKSRLFVN